MAKRRARRTVNRPSYKAQVADLAAELKRLTDANAARQGGASPAEAGAAAVDPNPAMVAGTVPSPLHAKIDATNARIDGLIDLIKGKLGLTAAAPVVVDPKQAFVDRLPAELQGDARILLGLDTPEGDAGDDTTAAALQPGSYTPQAEFILPILSALAAMPNGTGSSRDVIGRVGKAVAKRLKASDREKLSTGAVRWENAAMWARAKAINAGLMATGQPRGVWAITQQGREFLRSHTGR